MAEKKNGAKATKNGEPASRLARRSRGRVRHAVAGGTVARRGARRARRGRVEPRGPDAQGRREAEEVRGRRPGSTSRR
jgi:hypothetical protein